VAGPNPNTAYALSSTVSNRSSVPASNPRRTSIRRPLCDSTTNGLSSLLTSRLGDGATSTGSIGPATDRDPPCTRRRYLSSVPTARPRWRQNSCRDNPLASYSATRDAASDRLRRLRTTPTSLIDQVHHQMARRNRVRWSDAYVRGRKGMGAAISRMPGAPDKRMGLSGGARQGAKAI